MGNATKRIPVSEERWKQLGRLKEAGQTYDELIEQLIIQRDRKEILQLAKDAQQGRGQWHSLEQLPQE